MPGCREERSSRGLLEVPWFTLILRLHCLPEFRTQEEGLIWNKGSPGYNALQKQDVLRLAGPNGVLGNRQMCSQAGRCYFLRTSEERVLGGGNLMVLPLLCPSKCFRL